MSRGFIAVSRGIFEHPMFAPEPYTEREAWLWMIEQAVWREAKVRVGRTWIILARGQLAFATRFLASKWQWSEARVRRLLKRLQGDAMIEVLATRDATLITICNYDKYQGERRTDDAQPDAQSVTEVTRSRRKEEQLNQSTSIVEARKRASRLPDDWGPSSEDRSFAKALGFTDQQIKFHADKFRDFWRAKPGVGGTKLDWPATWRNWMRSEDERRPKPRPTDDWRNPLAGVR